MKAYEVEELQNNKGKCPVHLIVIIHYSPFTAFIIQRGAVVLYQGRILYICFIRRVIKSLA